MIAALKPPVAEQNRNSADLPIAFVSNVRDLRSPLNVETDGAILDRPVPPSVTEWLDAIPPERLPAGRYVLPAERVGACLSDLFRAVVGNAPELEWLCYDAQALATEVRHLSNTPQLRLRLEPVFDNACSKMHIDTVHARLICTYRGPGTELGTDQTQNDTLMTVPTGLPILLKGRLWPGSTAPTLRHKSPAIKGTGLARLVLVLEGCSDADVIPDYDQLYCGDSSDR